ncbi:MAG: hypothetical protein ABIJ18_03430 [archaeon]
METQINWRRALMAYGGFAALTLATASCTARTRNTEYESQVKTALYNFMEKHAVPNFERPENLEYQVTNAVCTPNYGMDHTLVVNVDGYGDFCVHSIPGEYETFFDKAFPRLFVMGVEKL